MLCYPERIMRQRLEDYLKRKERELGRKLNVTLLGYGSTNHAALEILQNIEGVRVTVRQVNITNLRLPARIELISGDKAFDDIDEDVILPSPSVRRESLKIPNESNFITDLDLLIASHPKRLFSISGSDGKSTTVALTSMMLSDVFPELFTGGNFGIPLFSANSSSEAFLLELSSFTLRYTAPSFGRAALTNVTPNHLDWHADLREYIECKLNLVRACDEPILVLDDEVSEKAVGALACFCLVSVRQTRKQILSRYKTEHTVTVEMGYILVDGQKVVAIGEVRRSEDHNILNLCVAIAMSIGYFDKDNVCRVARSFNGLSERCEIFTKNGVEYVSSSIDTTPRRTKTTLDSLGRRVRLILGGRGKGLPLDPLKNVLIKYAERIAVYGEIRDEMAEYLSSIPELSRIPTEGFPTLDKAIDYATEGVTPGETVVLSPAATSYGEFQNFTERGRFFRDHVMKNR